MKDERAYSMAALAVMTFGLVSLFVCKDEDEDESLNMFMFSNLYVLNLTCMWNFRRLFL